MGYRVLFETKDIVSSVGLFEPVEWVAMGTVAMYQSKHVIRRHKLAEILLNNVKLRYNVLDDAIVEVS